MTRLTSPVSKSTLRYLRCSCFTGNYYNLRLSCFRRGEFSIHHLFQGLLHLFQSCRFTNRLLQHLRFERLYHLFIPFDSLHKQWLHHLPIISNGIEKCQGINRRYLGFISNGNPCERCLIPLILIFLRMFDPGLRNPFHLQRQRIIQPEVI